MDVCDILTKWVEQRVASLKACNPNKGSEKQARERIQELFALLELVSLCDDESIFGKGEVIFLDFARLSPVLVNSPLSKVQKTAFMFWIINQNISRPYFDNEIIPVYGLSEKQAFGVPFDADFVANEVNREEIRQKLEAMQIIYATTIIKVAKTQEEVDAVGEALAVLEVSPGLIKIMQNSLRKIIGQINNIMDALKEKNANIGVQTAGEPERLVNSQPNIDRQYRLTRRQIEEYYNLETGKLKRPFTLPEIIMLAKMMKSIFLPDYVIETFIVKAEQTLTLRGTDVIAEYQELHDMLEFYKEGNPELSDYIAQIDDCLLEMAALGEEDQEERNEWSEMIREDVEAVLKLLPKDGKYVMKAANISVG